jgi:hypothetical protein
MHAHEPLRALRHEINDHRGAFTQRDPTTKIGPLAFWEHQARVICRQPGRAIMLIKITPDALDTRECGAILGSLRGAEPRPEREP